MTAPFAILPGWGLGSAPLQAVADELGGRMIDLPGYGTTPFSPHFDLAVELLAQQLNPQTQLMGWSLGAQFALAIASRYPEKIASLVLVSGTASFVQREGWPYAMPTGILDAFITGIQTDRESTLNRFIAGFNRGDTHSKAVTVALLRKIDLSSFSPSIPTLLSGLRWLGEIDIRPEMSNIKVNTLLIHGTTDPLMPVAAAKALSEMIPSAKLVTMEGCAHAPFISEPEIFLAHLAGFINE